MTERKSTSTYIVFNDDIKIEFSSNNQFVLKDSRGKIAYIDDIEYLVKKMKKWEMDKKLSKPQEIQLKDYLAMEKETLKEIKQFFEDAFNELEQETVKAVKKVNKKQGK